jgi:predicted RNA binding protein YcfA (HicA-like mRNA interferase family)
LTDPRAPVYSTRHEGRALLAILRNLGCEELRQKGSHVRVRCGGCFSTVPVHAGEDLGKGLLAKIERDLEPCLGAQWLKRATE